MTCPIGRPGATAGLTTAALLVLTACSIQGTLGGAEPERDETTGEITAGSRTNAFALRLGDCLDDESNEDTEEVDSVSTVPCDEEHNAEVYAVHAMEGEEFPGQDAVATAADEMCLADFEAFVGTAYDLSALDYTFLAPTEESWTAMDDREVLCIVVDPSGVVTGTLKDAQY